MNGTGTKSSTASPIATATAGEDDGTPCGRHRSHDGVRVGCAVGRLLPEAVHDEERVVDREPEADQLDEGRDVR